MSTKQRRDAIAQLQETLDQVAAQIQHLLDKENQQVLDYYRNRRYKQAEASRDAVRSLESARAYINSSLAALTEAAA